MAINPVADRLRQMKGSGINSAILSRMKKSMELLQGKRSKIFREDIELPSMWYPKEGAHIIDVIRYKAGRNDIISSPGVETYTYMFYQHQFGPMGPNRTSVICPGMYDKPCPICEYIAKIRASEDVSEALDKELKMISAKRRNLYNVYVTDDRKEKSKGLQIWDVASYYFEKALMATALIPAREGEDEQLIDFTEKTISFKIESKGNNYKDYMGFMLRDRDRYVVPPEIVKSALVLDEIVNILSYSEIKQLFDTMLNPEEAESTGRDYSARDVSDNRSYASSHETPTSDSSKVEESLKRIILAKDLDDLEIIVEEDNLVSIGLDPINFMGDFGSEKTRVIKYLNDYIANNSANSNYSRAGQTKEQLPLEQIMEVLKTASTMDEIEQIYIDHIEALGIGYPDSTNSDVIRRVLRSAIRELAKTRSTLKGNTSNLREELNAMTWIKLRIYVKKTPELDGIIDASDYSQDKREALIEDILAVMEDIPF